MDGESDRALLAHADAVTNTRHALAHHSTPHPGGDGSSAAESHAVGSESRWESQLQRWLATLNPGRTPREYEKAVRYFFETPGVPDALDELTFDLLLAYRGALALRAAPRGRTPMRRTRPADAQARVESPTSEALLEGTDSDAVDEQSRTSPGMKPLAPATVNIRLTALRQFLVHCALIGALPHLTSERIRLALRRLAVERRRPYQVLAESEWAGFLDAALLPLKLASRFAPDPVLDDVHTGGECAPTDEHGEELPEQPGPQGPWGRTRAERHEQAGESSTTSVPPQSREQMPRLPKSRAGLTGLRTAQRDHALLSLALATGLRAIELSLLDVGDLSREWHDGQEEWWLVLPDEKTKGQRGGRTLPLAPQLVEVLLAYVRSTGRRWEDPTDRKTPLFVSRPYAATSCAENPPRPGGRGASAGGHRTGFARLSTVQIRAVVDRVEQQWLESRLRGEDGPLAGETRLISPHALRHSTALALLEGQDTSRPPASVEHVRGWLGHFDIRTTQGYLAHLDARRHRRPFVLSPVANTPSGQPSTKEASPADESATG